MRRESNSATLPPVPRSHVVMTVAYGVSAAYVAPFLTSLRRVVDASEADVVLFVRPDVGHDVRRLAQEVDARLRPTNVTSSPSPLGPVFSTAEWERYHWYASECAHYVGLCLAADARDVWFQASPFAGVQLGAELALFEEDRSVPVGQSTAMTHWLRTSFWGDPVLSSIRRHPIINAGCVLGSSAGFTRLWAVLENTSLSREAWAPGGRKWRVRPEDQAALNYLVRTGRLMQGGVKYTIERRGAPSSVVNNVGWLLHPPPGKPAPPAAACIDAAAGRVYADDGVTLSPAVHQYDRSASLRSALLATLKNGTISPTITHPHRRSCSLLAADSAAHRPPQTKRSRS